MANLYCKPFRSVGGDPGAPRVKLTSYEPVGASMDDATDKLYRYDVELMREQFHEHGLPCSHTLEFRFLGFYGRGDHNRQPSESCGLR
jgi:hypothetical protein